MCGTIVEKSQRGRFACQKECGYSFFFLYNLLIIGLLVYTQIKLHFSDERFQAYQESNTARFENLERRLDRCEDSKPHHGSLPLQKLINLLNDIDENVVIEFSDHFDSQESNKDDNKREVISNNKFALDALLRLKQGPAGPPGAPGRDGRDAVNIVAVTHLINSTVHRLVSVQMNEVKLQAKSIPTVSGASYVRWGKTMCPGHSSYIYQGRAAGQYFTENGGSSQYLCMPDDPEYTAGANKSTVTNIYGVEYYKSHGLKSVTGSSNNVPCVLCQTDGRTSKVVFPAKLRCPDSSWTKEYSGFLMTEGVGIGHDGRTEYLCVDADAETIPGMIKSEYGSLLYSVGATCETGSRSGNLGHCPPYKESAPITCTVCSK